MIYELIHVMAKRKTNRKNKRSKKRGKKSCRSNFSSALCQLKRLKGKDQSRAMSMANDSFIRQFCSRVKKLKNAKLTPKLSTKLRRHRKKLRMLTNTRTSIKRKRKALSQRGGIFPLLMAALPAIASIGSAAISAAVR